MSEKDKKVIIDFIKYLENDSIKYEFKNSGWSYTNEIYAFISYCYDNDIILKYNDLEEANRLYIKNVEQMTKEDLRKYLYVIFNRERINAGIIMQSIKNKKILNVLEKLVSNQ